MQKKLSVVFISNYFTHHQKPFSDALYDVLDGNFSFVENVCMSDDRRELGWGGIEYPAYVIRPEQAFTADTRHLIETADVVIIGSAPNRMVVKRLCSGKLTFRYSERIFKKQPVLWKKAGYFLKWQINNLFKTSIHLLCSSAYAAADYTKLGLFRNKCYKWGYFPKTHSYEAVETLIKTKKKNSLVWVARYIDWKHPEIAIEIGRRLKREGYDFTISMIGTGPLLDQTAASVAEAGLENEIHILGVMTPEAVRTHMENAQIHIFTSDRNEGWGAVLNESMNSGCVPVANRAIGSAPFLVEDGQNGFLYNTVDELYEKVKYLLDHEQERIRMAENAYHTIVDEWNAENAAKQFITLATQLLEGNKEPTLRPNGVCSKAEILKD